MLLLITVFPYASTLSNQCLFSLLQDYYDGNLAYYDDSDEEGAEADCSKPKLKRSVSSPAGRKWSHPTRPGHHHPQGPHRGTGRPWKVRRHSVSSWDEASSESESSVTDSPTSPHPPQPITCPRTTSSPLRRPQSLQVSSALTEKGGKSVTGERASSETNNNDVHAYSAYHQNNSQNATGIYDAQGNIRLSSLGGQQVSQLSPLAGGEAPDSADLVFSSQSAAAASSSQQHQRSQHQNSQQQTSQGQRQPHQQTAPPRTDPGTDRVQGDSDSEAENQAPCTGTPGTPGGLTPTEARWSTSSVPPKKRWLPRSLSGGHVLVTDVTCNCVTVTFLESHTEKGFFKHTLSAEWSLSMPPPIPIQTTLQAART